MSTASENEFDLEKLFLPAWAQEPSASKYADYDGHEERPDRRGGRDRRGPRREGPPRREQGRPGGERRGPPRGEGGRGRPAGPRGPRGERTGPRRDEPRFHREPPLPLPEVQISLIPEEKGVESLARQIKVTGRAYPLFDIAQLILQKPERHNVAFAIKKNPEGQPVQPLFLCALDDTLWLSEDEAIGHVLRKHFATFYQAERTATEPPKGKYTFVAQCGLSGTVLGPPNHHDYQNQLRKLHAERFSRMPFEAYKARVRIVRDEEVVKKWVEDQSWKTEYLCLNLPEPLKLPTMEAVEKHFRETHKETMVKPVEAHTLGGAAARALRSSGLVRLVRSVWEDQRRFPLQIATVLSQQFASHGLQFFKVNKAITHVSVARPHYLDLEATPVSDGVKRIVDFINSHPRGNRRQLVENLAPSPPPTPIPVLPAAPPAPAEGQPAATEAPPASAAPAPADQPTAEQNAVIADLHWLVHQGHVIEFANGILETAKKPVPKPPRPVKAPEAAPGTTASAASAPPGEAAPAAAPAPGPVEPTLAADIVRPGEEALEAEALGTETAPLSRPAEQSAPNDTSPAAPAHQETSPPPLEPAPASTPATPVETPS